VAALEEEQSGEFDSDEAMAALVFRELPFYFARFGPVEAGYLETLKAETPNADALSLFNKKIFPAFDLRPLHPLITAPTLVITGAEDFICGPVCAEEMAGGIPGASKTILGDAGHMVFVEQPEAFRSAVQDFVLS
jgi:pimeloyl-ACP methyl ester carboxylesterase